jgi:hypothetical protein
MELEDILPLFAIVADQGWYLNGGKIRTRNGECPICVLANAILEKDDWKTAAWSAGIEIGFSMSRIDDFVTAADGNSINGDLPPSNSIRIIRAALLQILQPKPISECS